MKTISDLINFLSSFPSIGRRSAMKIAIEMCQNKERLMREFGKKIQELESKIYICENCHNIDTQNPCHICQDLNRNKIICLVDTVADLWNIEKTSFYNGFYFIINSTNIGSKDFDNLLTQLEMRIANLSNQSIIEEIIIGNNTKLDGQTFIFYVTDFLNSLKERKGYQFNITTLSKGVPSGSSIEYLDEKTILSALSERKAIV